jgi:predicted RNA binding protein YcfA (HicA-like mRNA interferase family)
MPKLPHVSGKEAVKALEKLGFAQVRQKGSHLILRRGPVGCVVPLHREIKIGNLSGVLRQAGVTPEEFINAL